MSYHRRYFADATILDSHRRIITDAADACATEVAEIVDTARQKWEAADVVASSGVRAALPMRSYSSKAGEPDV